MLTVFVSPHFDDVVGSISGTIAQQVVMGHDTEILTIFGGHEQSPLSSLAREIHAAWGYHPAVKVRRREDLTACRILNTKQRMLDFPEALYRLDHKNDPCYPTLDAIFKEPHPDDAVLAHKIAQEIEKIFASDSIKFYFPLGIGNHVDHFITNKAGQILKEKGYNVFFYAEFYYEDPEGFFTEFLKNAHKIELSPPEIAKKISAFSCYHSQIPSLFGTRENMRRYFQGRGRFEIINEPLQPVSSNISNTLLDHPPL